MDLHVTGIAGSTFDGVDAPRIETEDESETHSRDGDGRYPNRTPPAD